MKYRESRATILFSIHQHKNFVYVVKFSTFGTAGVFLNFVTGATCACNLFSSSFFLYLHMHAHTLPHTQTHTHREREAEDSEEKKEKIHPEVVQPRLPVLPSCKRPNRLFNPDEQNPGNDPQLCKNNCITCSCKI